MNQNISKSPGLLRRCTRAVTLQLLAHLEEFKACFFAARAAVAPAAITVGVASR